MKQGSNRLDLVRKSDGCMTRNHAKRSDLSIIGRRSFCSTITSRVWIADAACVLVVHACIADLLVSQHMMCSYGVDGDAEHHYQVARREESIEQLKFCSTSRYYLLWSV